MTIINVGTSKLFGDYFYTGKINSEYKFSFQVPDESNITTDLYFYADKESKLLGFNEKRKCNWKEP